MSNPPLAVVLLSGGLDSTTALAIAQHDGFAVCALTIRYGQRHDVEVAAARQVAKRYSVRAHSIIDVDLGQFGGSALTDELDVPKHESVDQIGDGIPVTYVPARNTIFLSCALAWAEVLNAHDIFIGVNAVDYSGYPDCRPEYITAFERLANLATKMGVSGQTVHIRAPLIELTKSQIIGRGLELGVDYSLTTSCYDPSPHGLACGQCDACLLRWKGFQENGTPDPIAYATRKE